MNPALREISDGLTAIIRPPRRITVAEAAAEHLYVSETRKWDSAIAPYMVEPMNDTASRHHDMVVFVGVARSGKTLSLIQGRWVYSVLCHPQDFAVVHSSQDLARDFSIRDMRRLHSDSPGMRSAMTGRASDNNTYDKTYRSGIMAVIAWPSDAQLASRTIPVMLLTDVDRWPKEVGGRSSIDQARKRTQTAGSLAMTVVESSPGTRVSLDVDIEAASWVIGKPISHAFPPTTSGVRANICELYNGGTMDWWYVPCSACGEFYPQNPSIERFSWVGDDPIKAAQTAGTVCPWCGSIHHDDEKQTENENGKWVSDGQVIDCYGNITGDSRAGHTYPSYALGGGAAAYQSRSSIVMKYLQAKRAVEDSGDESRLQTVVNDDIGAPYLSVYAADGRSASPIMKRAEQYQELTVPDGVRFMIAAVDVQKNRFVVQIHGFGHNRNRWLIDRYNIAYSERGENIRVDPAIYDDDWLLLRKLFTKTYPFEARQEVKMGIAGVLCDIGGREGVTDKSLAFWRALSPALRQRCRLVKGEPKEGAPLIEQRFPDTRNRRDRGVTRGDVPVYFINTNRMKDRINSDLQVSDLLASGYCHFSKWTKEWFFKELTREKRGPDGKWAGTGRNEAFDLMCYCEVGAIMGIPFGATKKGIDRPQFWENPPIFASIIANNALISGLILENCNKIEKQEHRPRAPRFKMRST